MDGLVLLPNVVVIAATNRPDILDQALLRPGRFDRLIYIPPPDEGGRMQILQIYTKNMPLTPDVDFTSLSKVTEGYSGADLQALCNEAAMSAVRRSEKNVTYDDFKDAMNRVGPTITPDVEGWYKSVIQQFRKPVKPATLIV